MVRSWVVSALERTAWLGIRQIVAMCGISGAVSTAGGLEASAIETQLEVQHHRGPDAGVSTLAAQG